MSSVLHQLHTIAAYYPDSPTAAEQFGAVALILSLALLYPCKHCAADFVKAVEQSPPTVGSRKEFVLWVCHQHNLVNEKLGV